MLTNRRKETFSESTPSVTRLGLAVAIAGLSMPIGSALVGVAGKDGVAVNSNLPFDWMFIAGVLLTTSPLWVLAVRLVYLLCWTRPVAAAFKLENWTFLSTHTLTQIKTETIETPNPTSIEFESLFEKAMNDALDKGDKRLLLVLDNLDRIDTEHALEIWSTLQTFLQDR